MKLCRVTPHRKKDRVPAAVLEKAINRKLTEGIERILLYGTSGDKEIDELFGGPLITPKDFLDDPKEFVKKQQKGTRL